MAEHDERRRTEPPWSVLRVDELADGRTLVQDAPGITRLARRSQMLKKRLAFDVSGEKR